MSLKYKLGHFDMKILLQRVKEASVTVAGKVHGKIGNGILVYFAVHHEDSAETSEWLAKKLINLRIFSDQEGKMNLNIMDIGGEVLVVSQFTLYSTCTKGRRPEFTSSAEPRKGEQIYEKFVGEVSEILGKKTQTGEFGAMMEVTSINDGPATFILEKF